MLELDKDEDTYQVFIKDGDAPFTSIGSGNVDPGRDGNSLRLGFNNNFSGTGEFFDLDRIYLTNESPIVDAVEPLTLKVNLTSGQTWIANDSTIAYEIDSYRITDDNPVGTLSTTGWSSLSDRSVDAIDGPDGDLIVGNGIGEIWDEAGGSNPKALSESFLFGSSTIMPTEQLSLGLAVTPGSSPALGVRVSHRAETGAILPGLIEFVIGEVACRATSTATAWSTWRTTPYGETTWARLMIPPSAAMATGRPESRKPTTWCGSKASDRLARPPPVRWLRLRPYRNRRHYCWPAWPCSFAGASGGVRRDEHHCLRHLRAGSKSIPGQQTRCERIGVVPRGTLWAAVDALTSENPQKRQIL